MALAFCTYGTVQINTELVPAQPGKIIRILKLVITTWEDLKVTLVSDPESDPQDLTPALHAGAGSGFSLQLGRRFALATGRGKALGFSAAFQMASAEYSIAVWYEVVT
jgi:hypothetical protein